MRPVALLVLLALATPLAAQDSVSTAIPPAAARRVVELYNAPATVHFSGQARVPAESTIRGTVAVLDGTLSVAGRVEGDVVVINGDVELVAGGTITGALTVVGGGIRDQGGRVLGARAAYSDRLEYLKRGEHIYADVGSAVEPAPEPPRQAAAAPPPADSVRDTERAGWAAADTAPGRARPRSRDENGDEGAGWSVERAWGREGRADFIVATGQSYNRVEGLPITFGPVIQTSGRNPLRLRAMGIFRSESGPELGPERWGYDLKAEQFLGGRGELRVGATAFRRIDPIEDWHLTKLENGLSTFFLHRDYRDHFERSGGAAFVALSPRGSPLEAMLEYRAETERSQAAGSPFTLFDNSAEWRPQPLVAHGRVHSVGATLRIDTRSNSDDPGSGWLVQGRVEQGLDAALRQPDYVSFYDPSSPLPPVASGGAVYGRFSAGTVEVRRYNRIGPWSRLNLRALAGGSLDGGALPPQRQHALGGAGSLPAFPLFSRDCGARGQRVMRASEVAAHDPADPRLPTQWFRAYGCDRFALLQAEYRGDLSLHLRWNEDDPDADDDAGWVRSALRHGLSTEFAWVLFADAGRGWALDDRLRDTDTAADVGVGVMVGRLGVYGAVPVTSGGSFNLFIRLSPRI